MSNSIVIYHGRDDKVYVVDPDCIPHFDDTPPLLRIAAEVIKAGYSGVVIDEKRLFNGRFVHCLSTNGATPEGRIVAEVSVAHNAGNLMPSTATVLECIRREYDKSRRQS